jgi:hypothetical protein
MKILEMIDLATDLAKDPQEVLPNDLHHDIFRNPSTQERGGQI